MLKNSKDAYLVTILFLQLGLLLLPFVVEMSALAVAFLLPVNVLMVGTNYHCVVHNFIHLPFFKSRALNNAFSLLNSFGLGLPQSPYRFHHLNHHRHNNRPEEGGSSTRRYGKDGRDENVFTYSFLGIFRTDLVGLTRQAARNSVQPYVEIAAMLAVLGVLAYLNWKLFLSYLLPSYLLGQSFALWQNYCEHHRADPYDRKRDSVSCYNRFYNFVWFNNGYHQEHHLAPRVHWTKIPELRSELPEDRIIVKGCHLVNSF